MHSFSKEQIIAHDKQKGSLFSIILTGLIGNVMEWYDFAVYGYFAAVLGKLFFPSTDTTISLLAAFGTFAVGFLMRPLGGIVFGRLGDAVGRQRLWLSQSFAWPFPPCSWPSYRLMTK